MTRIDNPFMDVHQLGVSTGKVKSHRNPPEFIRSLMARQHLRPASAEETRRLLEECVRKNELPPGNIFICLDEAEGTSFPAFHLAVDGVITEVEFPVDKIDGKFQLFPVQAA